MQPSRFPRDNLHFDTPELLAADRLMMQLTLSTGATNTLVFSLKNALLRRNASFTQVSLSSSKKYVQDLQNRSIEDVIRADSVSMRISV